MFEEVPRTRRGLARLTARHVVLGPFVIGGGVLLAAVGGSVAVATTVITASSLRTSDVPPRPIRPPAAVATSHPTSAQHRPAAGASARPVHPATARPAVGNPSSARAVPSPSAVASLGTAVSSAPASAGSNRTDRPTASPSGTSSGPAGNALIYVTGYDSAGQRLQFEYAVVSPGAGPDASDLYRVDSTQQYSATLATDLAVTSGGQLCPPAGSRCSTDQLIAGAGRGFFAIVAIDPADQLHSIIEVDNAASTGYAPAVTAVASPSPRPTRS